MNKPNKPKFTPKMGPFFLHEGGFSTFLAFALTYMSDCYFFIAFATVSTGEIDRIFAGNATDCSNREENVAPLETT